MPNFGWEFDADARGAGGGHVSDDGNSGGGVTMSFYQAVAEKGPSICKGPEKLMPCGDNLAGLPKADAIILTDGHPGNPILRLRSINPSVGGDLEHPVVSRWWIPKRARRVRLAVG